MKHRLSMKSLIIGLLIFSACTYVLHYVIFRDFHHISIFFLHDVAFLPLEVLLVSVFLDRIVERTHENENRLKISMIESVFFSESGGDMLRYFISCDVESGILCPQLNVTPQWTKSEFLAAKAFLRSYDFTVETEKIDFFSLHYHLNKNRELYLKMIENPALTEHSEFTHLIMGLYHLWEELDYHTDLYALPEPQHQRLMGIVNGLYRLLVDEWLDNAYYLIKIKSPRIEHVIRTNPFFDK